VSNVARDASEPPYVPQFPLGATSSQAAMAAELEGSPIPAPGGIVERLKSRQFALSRTIPNHEAARAEPDASMSRGFGNNLGES